MSMIVRKVSDYQRPARKRARTTKNYSLLKSKGARLGLYKNSVSRCTKSAYKDFLVFASTVNEYGFGVNASGYQFTTNGIIPTTTAWTGASDISALYDAYRVIGFQITATFNQNVSSVTTGVVETLPFMYVCKDYTDISTVSGSFNELSQKTDTIQICLGRNSNKSYDYKGWVVPKISGAAFSSGTTVGYTEPRAKQWVALSNPTGGPIDVVHNGIKFFIDNTAMTAASTVNIGTIRFYIKCFFEMKHST